MTNNHVFYNKQRAIKALCFFLFLMLGAVTVHANGTDYYFKATATASPTGAGTVYVSNEEKEGTYETTSTATWSSSSTGQAATSTVYLFAKPATGFAFDHWEYTVNNETKTLSGSKASATMTSGSTDQNSPVTTNYTAIFVKEGLITVASSDESKGTVAISKADNEQGDEVTLTANNDFFVAKFKGWKLNDEGDYITDNPLTVTATEKAKYVAYFEEASSDGEYFYMYNHRTSRYFGVWGTATDVKNDRYLACSAMLLPKDYIHDEPAIVLRVKGTTDKNGGLTDCDITGQGVNTYDLAKYHFTIGKFADNTYDIYGKMGSKYGYVVDYSDCGIYIDKKDANGNQINVNRPGVYNSSDLGNDNQYFWTFLPLDEAHINTNYFGATADARMKYTLNGEDRYLTTMYTSFPYQCYKKDGVEAYYVSEISGGTVKLAKIAGGLVPANTPVILACKGTTAKENRLIPYTGSVAALSGTNHLKGSFQLSTTTETKNGKDYVAADGKTTFDSKTMRVLSANKAGTVGFYKLADGTLLTANKCWLEGDFSGSNAKNFTLVFGDSEATGIEEVAFPETSGRRGAVAPEGWYNLQGQKVDKPTKGIFIHNGKKVVIR